MERHTTRGSAAARAALADIDATRRRLAERATSPRWYRVAVGVSVTGMFVLLALAPTTVSLWAPLLSGLVPVALAWLLTRVTGVSVHRYGSVPGTRRIYAVYVVLLGVAVLGGLALVRESRLPWLAVPVAVAVFVLVQVTELRIDAALRRGLAA